MKIRVRINTIVFETMTLSRTGTEYLTTEEWNELNALRMAINYYPHTVAP